MKRLLSCLLLSIALIISSGCETPKPAADLVLTNATVITLTDSADTPDTVAVRDGRIIYVGDRAGADPMINEQTDVRNLGGATVLPGLVDAHCHLLGLGMALETVNLTGTMSYDDVIEKVVERASTLAPGTWIRGRGWDQNDWADTRFPTHEALSEAVPDHPVWLTRIDGHAGLANENAMAMAGITAETVDPDGGKILRNANGTPTGVFVDNAELLIQELIPSLTPMDRRRMLAAASEACLSVGLTGVHDMGMLPEQIDDYKAVLDNGKLGLRVYAMLEAPEDGIKRTDYLNKHRVNGYADGMLTVRGVKLYMDGALGSRGAAMLTDYSDEPGNRGLLVTPFDEAVAVCRAALEAGYQVCTHAIGDRGNRMILNVYEEALAAYPEKDHRFRVEHAQILSPGDIPRFSKMGVIPSMQPTHATSDMPWAETRVGADRIAGAYAWRSLMDTGVTIPCGSDFPIESHNPMLGIYAAVTRMDRTGNPEGGWLPDQRMIRLEALKGFSTWAAHARFMESELGTIETGKLADITVLADNPLTCPEDQLDDIEAVMTIVSGKIRYERNTP